MSQRSGDNLKLALLVEQINKRYGIKDKLVMKKYVCYFFGYLYAILGWY